MISAEDFYFKEPLYKVFEYTESDFNALFDLIYFSGKIDNYCPQCKKETIFKANPQYPKANKQTSSYSPDLLSYFSKFSEEKTIDYFKNETFSLSFSCERERPYYYDHACAFHIKFGVLEYKKFFFQKIGQYPSFADLNDYKTQKFNKVLSPEKFNELNKGIGLASHGVGIGSFVYLRRIFEDLILEVYNAHKEMIDDQLEEKKFNTLVMGKKIEVLRPFLPDFVYENSALYGLMSKGIHQLTEEECLEQYKVVELGIRLVLEEKLLSFKKRGMITEFNKMKSKL